MRLPQETKYRFKIHQNATLNEVQELDRDELIREVNGLNDWMLRNGQVGIWLNPKVTIAGKTYYWMHLDFELPGHSGTLQETIEAAQDFYLILWENRLTEGLRIICSGGGVRFLWPWLVPEEYGPAFMAWMKGTKNLDVSPFTNSAQCYRFLANRDHIRQGKPKNCHVEVMPLDQNFMDLDAVEYRRLTAGPPDPEHYKRIFPSLLPDDFMPEPWRAFLEPWRRAEKFRRAIFTPRFPRLPEGINWYAIEKALADKGITSRELRAIGGGVSIRKLSSCPSCGRKDGNPYLSNGRLKCHHDNTCEASKSKGGLGPWQWIEGYEAIHEDPESQVSGTHTLEDARKSIYEAIRGEGHLVIKATAGAGKTHAALQAVVDSYREKPELTLLSVPTRANIEEILQKARDLAGLDMPVRKIEGRHSGNCQKSGLCRKAGASGLSPKLRVCIGCDGSKVETACLYNRQFKDLGKSGLIVTTHSSAQIMLVERFKPDVWIVDENPLSELSLVKEVSQEAMMGIRRYIPLECRETLMRVFDAGLDQSKLIGNRWQHGRLYATEAPGGQWAEEGATASLWEMAGITDQDKQELSRSLAVFEPALLENPWEWQKRLDEWGVDLFALQWLKIALGQEPGTAYVKTHSGSRPIFFCFHRVNIPDFDGRIIHLDATGHMPEIEALFKRRFVEVHATVECPECRTVHLKRNFGKTLAENATTDRIRAEVQSCIGQLSPNDKSVLIVTHQAIEAEARDAARALDSTRSYSSLHFYGTRGLNAFEDFDAVIMLGTPTLNPASLVDDGLILFPDKTDRETWERHRSETESYQAVHRVRPVKGGRTIVVLGRSWPGYLEVKPETTVSMERGAEARTTAQAIERLEWLVETIGFASPDAAIAVNVGRKKELELYNDVVKSPDNPLLYYLKTVLTDSINKDVLEKEGAPTPPPIEVLLSGYMKISLSFHSQNYWNALIDAYLGKNPDAPVFIVPMATNDEKGQRMLGTIEAVRHFYAALGAEINTENWRQVRRASNEQTTGGTPGPGPYDFNDGADQTAAYCEAGGEVLPGLDAGGQVSSGRDLLWDVGMPDDPQAFPSGPELYKGTAQNGSVGRVSRGQQRPENGAQGAGVLRQHNDPPDLYQPEMKTRTFHSGACASGVKP